MNLGSNFSAINVSCMLIGTCVLSENRGLKCFGYNYYGQLGYGDYNNRGDEDGEMGDNLPYVDLGTEWVTYKLFSLHNMCCATSYSFEVKCWGE